MTVFSCRAAPIEDSGGVRLSSTMACQCGFHGGAQPAKNKLLHHLGDPLDSESAIDDGVFAFVLFSDALKIELEQQLDGVDSTRPVHRLCEVGKRKGGLSIHIEVQRGDCTR